MNDQYLWDRSGEPDPEIVRLEQTLGPLGDRGRPLDLTVTRRLPGRPRWSQAVIPLALAASVVLAVGLLWARPGRLPAGWTVEAVEGRVVAGGRAIGAAVRVPPGQHIATGKAGRARLRAEGLGTLTLGPNTRLRAQHIGQGRHWFALDAGSIEADITAAPGVFAVETPSARAVDLGCQYTLEVTSDGAGLLRVSLGWVGLTRAGRESLVPAGAMCALRAGVGPGTPYFEGATAAFVEALASIDGGAPLERAGALPVVLSESRPLDAIALWHLLARLDGPAAERVYDRLAQFVPPPESVSRAAALAREPAALAAWWDAIGLGDLALLRAGMVRIR